MTGNALALLLDVHPVTVSKWLHGVQCPRPDVTAKIRDISGGSVTADDLQAPFFKRRAAAA